MLAETFNFRMMEDSEASDSVDEVPEAKRRKLDSSLNFSMDVDAMKVWMSIWLGRENK